MNRREFVTAMLAAFVLDPERLLWVRGKKTFFLPALTVNDSFGATACPTADALNTTLKAAAYLGIKLTPERLFGPFRRGIDLRPYMNRPEGLLPE